MLFGQPYCWMVIVMSFGSKAEALDQSGQRRYSTLNVVSYFQGAAILGSVSSGHVV